MKVKIIKASIENCAGKRILKPNNKVIDIKELNEYRRSVKETEHDIVLLTYEEMGCKSNN